MSKNMLRYKLYVITIMLMWPLLLLSQINWEGGQQSGAQLTIVDEDLDISSVNELTGPAYIHAYGADVVVTVTTLDSIVSSSYQFYLSTENDHSITFSLGNDLTFTGSGTNDFLITFSSDSHTAPLYFSIAGDHTLNFGVNNTNGTKFITLMGAQPPHVEFTRFAPFDSDAVVNVALNSLISYGALTGITNGDSAHVHFNATNSVDNTGRLKLVINDGGGVIVGGNQVSTYANPTLSDIAFFTPAGGNAILELLNTGTLDGQSSWAGFQVVNHNTQWPQMISNPFLEPNGGQASQGKTTGFVLQANGTVQLDNYTYLDYIGSYTNITLVPNTEAQYLDDKGALNQNIKDRNPSAFIVDGNPTNISAVPASIVLSGTSAIYFRSGVDSDDVESLPTYTIDPAEITHGAGEIVFDVEGLVNITGDVSGQSALQILSMQVSSTGGPVYIDAPERIFPARTFAEDPYGNPYIYNSACFLINNYMNLFDTVLMHTDENHQVYQNNIGAQSEPTYIGGEYFKLARTADEIQNGTNLLPRPKIALYNSDFTLHSSAALTGVDILVTNTVIVVGDEELRGNESTLVFYENGRVIDEGSGRNLILGTTIGSLASDGSVNAGTIISQDAHLDVMQTFAQASVTPHSLSLLVAPNNDFINNNIQGYIANQYSVQSIFLAHGSNISIGTNGAADTYGDTVTTPTLAILGDFFSIETQGGNLNQPEQTVAQGEGAIFVDANGIMLIGNNRAKIGTMIGKSRNGLVNLPARQVLFGNRVGITQSNLDLTDPNQWVIVAANAQLSDYTLDWENAIKDYVGSVTFIPYELPNTPLPCNVPSVINANLWAVPTIQGEVDQFQILNSRLGDQATILVDGGLIRELVMLTGENVGTAPVGVVALQNNATVGLGTANRNPDSLDAGVVLGVNGITLMPNGNAEVFLNSDAIINNVAHIVTGTMFGTQGTTNRLIISSVVPHELRIKSGGVLDLSQFSNPNQKLQFGGQVSLVLEPGAVVIMNGGQLNMTEDSRIVVQPLNSATVPSGSLTASDSARSSIIGSGNVQFSENAQLIVYRDGYFGVETGPINTYISPTLTSTSCSNVTTQTWTMLDASQIVIGDSENYGGAFQVGNTQDLGGSIDFTLNVNGTDALLNLNNQGFFGLATGIVTKPHGAPNGWVVAPLFNVDAIRLNINEGTVQSNQAYPSSSQFASVFAIGNPANAPDYFFTYSKSNAIMLGGGNLVEISGQTAPTVEVTDGVITTSLSSSVIVSLPMLADQSKIGANALPIPATATQLFTYLKKVPYNSQSTKLACIFRSALNESTTTYVNGSTIVRELASAILGQGGSYVAPDKAEQIGVVGMALNTGGQTQYMQVNP